MTHPTLGRRAALLLPLAAPLALSGCGFFDSIFETPPKPKIPGLREPVIASNRGLSVDPGVPPVVLPPSVVNAGWPQAGGNPSHLMGQLEAAPALSPAWKVDIGEGGGYRRKILAQPIASDGLVHTMDSNGVLRAFQLADGRPVWRYDTRKGTKTDLNVGGGLGVDGGVLYAVNGLAVAMALDADSGRVKWRITLPSPTRSAPTVADGRLFVTTIDDKLYALATDDGRVLWTHQAASASTTLLGQPAPAYADGVVVAGFGSGELAALRGDSGDVAWTDSLASVQGKNAIADLSAIRGLPVISGGTVYAIGLGGLMLAIDVRSGRRLWERDVAGEDSIWCAGDWLFVVSLDQRIAAVNRIDGRVAWVTQLPRYKNKDNTGAIYWYGPALVSGRLIVGGTHSEALSISPYTGEVLGRQKLSAYASFGPTVADRTVFIVTDDGRLTAFR